MTLNHRRPPKHSTHAMPGTAAKIAEMHHRYARGEQIFHTLDARVNYKAYIPRREPTDDDSEPIYHGAIVQRLRDIDAAILELAGVNVT